MTLKYASVFHWGSPDTTHQQLQNRFSSLAILYRFLQWSHVAARKLIVLKVYHSCHQLPHHFAHHIITTSRLKILLISAGLPTCLSITPSSRKWWLCQIWRRCDSSATFHVPSLLPSLHDIMRSLTISALQIVFGEKVRSNFHLHNSVSRAARSVPLNKDSRSLEATSIIRHSQRLFASVKCVTCLNAMERCV